MSVYKATDELPKVSYTDESLKKGIRRKSHEHYEDCRSGEEKIARDALIADQNLMKGETNALVKTITIYTVV